MAVLLFGRGFRFPEVGAVRYGVVVVRFGECIYDRFESRNVLERLLLDMYGPIFRKFMEVNEVTSVVINFPGFITFDLEKCFSRIVQSDRKSVV